MSVSYDDRRVWQNIATELKDELILKLISNLECSICSDVMHVPFLATCGHSFCYGCLEAWFETKVNCPTCRKDMVEAPILNISLKEASSAITDLIIETLEDDKHKAKLASHRVQLVEDYEKASRSKSLFKEAFSSAPTLVDISDGVPRCGNCHWEAHGSVCLNCGSRFRHPRGDSYYDSEDGDAYNEDEEEEGIYGIADEDAYDSADSFVDDREIVDDNSSNSSNASDDLSPGDGLDHEETEFHGSYSDAGGYDDGWSNGFAGFGSPVYIDWTGSDDDRSIIMHPLTTNESQERLGAQRQEARPAEVEGRMQSLHLDTNGELLNELDGQHESDVQRYNNREHRRKRRINVVSSDSE